MISKKILKRNKKEIITGLALALFLNFANLIWVALEPVVSKEITMSDNTIKIILSVISLFVLAFLIWIMDKQ